MPTTDCATGIALPDLSSEASPVKASERPSEQTSKPLKGLFFGFTATVTLGLGLASWYLGVRIVAADEVAPSSTTTSKTLDSTPAPVAPPVIAPTTSVPPTPANIYLQVAGLGPKQDAGFARSLQAKGFRVQIQSGDRADNARIVIGPYSSHTEMEQAQRRLQSAGVLAVEVAN
jgi:cell division protein FtsN